MTDHTNLIHRYIDAWNQADPTIRQALVEELFSGDARYTDPMAVAKGPEAIAATIGAVQNQFPGFTFRLVGDVDGHHDQIRFTWELAPAGKPAPIIGFDVAVVNSDDRICTVLGFLDRVPQVQAE